MKIRKRHRKPRKVKGTGRDAASRPDHFDGAPPFSFAPGNITFPFDKEPDGFYEATRPILDEAADACEASDADPVLRMPLIVDRGDYEVWTPDGWVQVDNFDTPSASEGGAQQDTDPPGGRPEDYRDDDIEGA